MPLLTTASAISRMSVSLTLHPNLFQLFHPIGGVGARDADVCADVAGTRRVAKGPTRRQARSARIKKNHRMFIFPRDIGYVTPYAESSTPLHEVRCRGEKSERTRTCRAQEFNGFRPTQILDRSETTASRQRSEGA